MRYLDRALRDRAAARIEELYELGEDIDTFFAREVVGLRPSTGV